MIKLISDRLKDAELTGAVLLNIFDHLETVMLDSNSGQSAITLGYLNPEDTLEEGTFVPTINLVLTRYQKPD